jgi:hypothetical protein
VAAMGADYIERRLQERVPTIRKPSGALAGVCRFFESALDGIEISKGKPGRLGTTDMGAASDLAISEAVCRALADSSVTTTEDLQRFLQENLRLTNLIKDSDEGALNREGCLKLVAFLLELQRQGEVDSFQQAFGNVGDDDD